MQGADIRATQGQASTRPGGAPHASAAKTRPGQATADALARRARLEAIAPQEAWDAIIRACAPVEAEDVPVRHAAGRVCATDARSMVDLPPETNSAMDGFAVRAADGSHHSATVVGESRAGSPYEGPLAAGEVVRIATGAPLPAHADAVVRIEDAVEEPGGRVSLPDVDPGCDVRRAGEDLSAGTIVVSAGTRLAPHHLVALASAGLATVSCHRRPVVSIVVTGDEIAAAGRPLESGQVYDVHGVALPALIEGAGGCIGELVHVGDDGPLLERTLGALAPCDVAIVTGGLSVGEHDHTRRAFDAVGVKLLVPRLLLRPGQPTAVGVDPGSRLWFGLPGNPVSAFAVAALLLVPALHALAGGEPPPLGGRIAPLGEAVQPDATRWLALRASRGVDGVLILGGQASHRVGPLAAADLLALIPPGDDELPPGTELAVVTLSTHDAMSADERPARGAR